jgi:Flp pilus assembly protein TadG
MSALANSSVLADNTGMRRRRERQRGQALVEFALVLPLFLLLLLGIVQFGTVFRDYIALTDATRVGARQAAVARSIQPESARVPNIVAKTEKAAVNLDKTKMVVTVEPVMLDGVTPGWEQAGDVTVRATYPFRISLFGQVVFGGTLKSRTTERVE